MSRIFWTKDEYFSKKGLLEWLHECVDENIRGEPYSYYYYSDGSSSWAYKSQNYKWEISCSMDRVIFELDDEYDVLYKLKWS